MGRGDETPHNFALISAMTLRAVTVYTDYKSPYAYLAKDLAYELERDFPVRLEWLPYVLDIPSFLGSARVDADGRCWKQNRNAHQWRRVRYSYMDCRRQAHKRGLVIRGPQKIWDSSLAAAGMLYAQARRRCACSVATMTAVFERFWKRELDIEDVAVIAAVLTEAGADGAAFAAQAQAGRDEVAAISRAAEASRRVRRAEFRRRWRAVLGREHLPDIRAMLATDDDRLTINTGGNIMRAAIFRNGDIVVDTIADPTASRRPGAGEDAVLRHLRHRSARGEAHAAVCRALASHRRTLADGSDARRGVRP